MPEARLARAREGYEGYVYQPRRHRLAFHPLAFSFLWPMPARYDVLFGRGTLLAETDAEFQAHSQRLAVTDPDMFID